MVWKLLEVFVVLDEFRFILANTGWNIPILPNTRNKLKESLGFIYVFQMGMNYSPLLSDAIPTIFPFSHTISFEPITYVCLLLPDLSASLQLFFYVGLSRQIFFNTIRCCFYNIAIANPISHIALGLWSRFLPQFDIERYDYFLDGVILTS